MKIIAIGVTISKLNYLYVIFKWKQTNDGKNKMIEYIETKVVSVNFLWGEENVKR